MQHAQTYAQPLSPLIGCQVMKPLPSEAKKRAAPVRSCGAPGHGKLCKDTTFDTDTAPVMTAMRLATSKALINRKFQLRDD